MRVHPAEEKGENDSIALTKGKRGIQKLDESMFKPWGGSSCSRASSDSGSETAICKGAP